MILASFTREIFSSHIFLNQDDQILKTVVEEDFKANSSSVWHSSEVGLISAHFKWINRYKLGLHPKKLCSSFGVIGRVTSVMKYQTLIGSIA